MSQDNLQTMIMQNLGGGGGVKEVYYGIVQLVNGATFWLMAAVDPPQLRWTLCEKYMARMMDQKFEEQQDFTELFTRQSLVRQ